MQNYEKRDVGQGQMLEDAGKQMGRKQTTN